MGRLIRSLARLAGTVTSAAVLGSCREPFSVFCAGVGFPGVAVQVKDGLGRPAALGAKLLARDGLYVDSAFGEYDPWVIGAAYNRAGTYSLQITRPWYRRVDLPEVHV